MGADRIIYFRTDGNSRIATGHLVRTLSIARACQRLGMEVCFLLSDEESRELLTGFLPDARREDDSEAYGSGEFSGRLSVKVLKTAVFDDLERELAEVSFLLTHISHGAEKPVYFLDSYFVTEKYLLSLQPLAKTAYLDDLQLFDYPVSLLINYDVITQETLPSYEAAYSNAKKTLLGAVYAPVREQFQNRMAPLREAVSDILVTTGGSDPFHFCLDLLRTLRTRSSCLSSQEATPVFHIVIGRLNTDSRQLHELAKDLPFVTLHENVTDLSFLMRDCDLAVSAAGTTLYELCALGVPAVSFTMADNQLTAARAFADAGAIPCAGDIRENSGKVIEEILLFVTEMSELCFDCVPAAPASCLVPRKAARQAMIRLTDGTGAMKIAQALWKL